MAANTTNTSRGDEVDQIVTHRTTHHPLDTRFVTSALALALVLKCLASASQDLSSDQMALDGFLDGAADEMSPARLHSNSCEDEVMTYLDVHQDDDMINLGAADLAPQSYSNFGF